MFKFWRICWFIAYFCFNFFGDWLLNIPDPSSTNQTRKAMIQLKYKIYSEVLKQMRCIFKNSISRFRAKTQTPKSETNNFYFLIFGGSTHVKGSLKEIFLVQKKKTKQKEYTVLVLRIC